MAIDNTGGIMSSEHGATPDGSSDTEAALQRELKREQAEGSGAIGDMPIDRNVGGSSTWVTLPVGDAAQPADSAPRHANATEAGAEVRKGVRDELADRLRRRGVNISSHDSDEQLVNLLEAVERFEAAVEARGGDLMMDEPTGDSPPSEPDDRAFVLPKRVGGDSVASFIERIAEARDRVTHTRRPTE
jgi:post-segregation antitoxin (ccd killing protein)